MSSFGNSSYEYILTNQALPYDDSLVSWVIRYCLIKDRNFLGALILYKDELITANDFLKFLLWWESCKYYGQNYLNNSYFGIIQQYLGMLNRLESEHIDTRSAFWQGRVPLRTFLDDLIEQFA
jgi:hypothetical protein